MAVETSLSQNMNGLNEKLVYKPVFPTYNLPTFVGSGDAESYQKDMDNFSLPGHLDVYTPELFINHEIHSIPFNIPPPPPHKIIQYQNIIFKKDRKNYQSKKNVSPDGEEKCVEVHKDDDKVKPVDKNNKRVKNEEQKTDKRKNKYPIVYFPDCRNTYGSTNNNNKNSRFFLNNRHKNSKTFNPDSTSRRVHGLMERFKSKAYLMKIHHPVNLLNGGPFDQLNQAIWDVFVAKTQKEETYISKLETWKSLFLMVKNYLNSYGLFIVGSTMSGFGLESSDIDMCLLTKPLINNPKMDAVYHLDNVKNLLVQNGLIEDAELIVAKVPILKFKHLETGFEIDLNCNNGIGIRNTQLLHYYSRLDWRVRPLVIIVKVWAQINNINDAKNMTISSYSFALMVINYLQCGITPPVVPCLHGLLPNVFNKEGESLCPDIEEDIDLIIRDFKSDNMCCLGELFLGFLKYYSCFNYAEFAISVRTGSRLPIDVCRFMKAPRNDVNQWKFLCIEEPFNFTNTARSVFDIEKFQFIKETFRSSYMELAYTKNLHKILPINFEKCQR